jgi:ssDNA thymidine ADP-ribosyltransferase, DarT
MAEFLVYERLPVGCVAGIAVRTDGTKEKVDAILAPQGVSLPVWVRPGGVRQICR